MDLAHDNIDDTEHIQQPFYMFTWRGLDSGIKRSLMTTLEHYF